MWVRARPENGQVTLTVVDWKEREAEPDPPMEPVEQERQADLVRAAAGWNWRVDNDLRFLAMPRTGPVAAAEVWPETGSLLTAFLHVEAGPQPDLSIMYTSAEVLRTHNGRLGKK